MVTARNDIRTNLGWVYLAVANHGNHENLVFHSDRGTQYSSRGYRTMLNELKIEPSMSAPGCPYDDAAMESFFRQPEERVDLSSDLR